MKSKVYLSTLECFCNCVFGLNRFFPNLFFFLKSIQIVDLKTFSIIQTKLQFQFNIF